MIFFQSLTQDDLAQLLLPLSRDGKRLSETEEQAEARALKRARMRSRMLFVWVYQRMVTDWSLMTDLSKDLRQWLSENVTIYRPEEQYNRQALDGTHKFLWKLVDGKTIESVIIPAALQEREGEEADERLREPASERQRQEDGKAFAGVEADAELDSGRWGRLTACISSQVGCAMACKFCLTGVQGLDRHLQIHEIVGQIHELRRVAPITNIVFMGMGEPLHNLDNVSKACQILLDECGLNFSKRKVTVSTSGLVPAIEELGKRVDVSLAISLNGTTDEQRSAIMPVNKRWNLDALMKACRDYPLGPHRRITFEYVLLKDFNDTLEDAARIVKLTRGIPSKINLIPFNEHPGADFKRPDDSRVREFQKYLLNHDRVATVRISRGRDILAACGQLRSIFGTARGTEKHRDYAAEATS